MTTHRRPTFSDWRATLVAGAVLGIVILGVGGRLGMRALALIQGQTPLFTIDGSIAITLLGGVAGIVIAVFFLLARAAFPEHRAVRTVIFSALVGLVVARGLNPVSLIKLEIFGPLFLLHGALLTVYWCRVRFGHGSIVGFYRRGAVSRRKAGAVGSTPTKSTGARASAGFDSRTATL